jgi:hypothetical protein
MVRVSVELKQSTVPPKEPPGFSQVPGPPGQLKPEWIGLMRMDVPGGSPFRIS